MPAPATRRCSSARREHKIGLSLGYSELDARRAPFNTVDPRRPRRQDRRQVPQDPSARPRRARSRRSIPASREALFRARRSGFPVWRTIGGIVGMCICNDRRWPETYRVMGLQGVELIMLGYNTPAMNSRSRRGAGAAHVSTTSCRCRPAPIRTPPGWWRRRSAASRTGILVRRQLHRHPGRRDRRAGADRGRRARGRRLRSRRHSLGKRTIFDFARHRRIEHYGRITGQTGMNLPP